MTQKLLQQQAVAWRGGLCFRVDGENTLWFLSLCPLGIDCGEMMPFCPAQSQSVDPSPGGLAGIWVWYRPFLLSTLGAGPWGAHYRKKWGFCGETLSSHLIHTHTTFPLFDFFLGTGL